MPPDPQTRDVRLRLRPHNSILRHVWALNGSGELKIRAKVKIAWQVRGRKVKNSSLTLEGKGHPSGAGAELQRDGKDDSREVATRHLVMANVGFAP